MNIDTREARIIFQNALAHATKIVIHNAGTEGVEVEDVLKMAKQIAREVIMIGQKG
jgi:hypothetical protein|tara:strand:+ start:282 stop:449 length:168 start_codon:yes stop_codon:yes gene_type:complete